jgi:hypothetical protein
MENTRRILKANACGSIIWGFKMSEPKKFYFNYRKYQSRKIDLAKLDALIDTVLSGGTNKIAAIIAAIQVLLFVAYVWIRKSIIDEKIKLAKQDYELGRINENDDILDDDNLDVIKNDNLD